MVGRKSVKRLLIGGKNKQIFASREVFTLEQTFHKGTSIRSKLLKLHKFIKATRRALTVRTLQYEKLKNKITVFMKFMRPSHMKTMPIAGV